jgi:hypothetical protein
LYIQRSARQGLCLSFFIFLKKHLPCVWGLAHVKDQIVAMRFIRRRTAKARPRRFSRPAVSTFIFSCTVFDARQMLFVVRALESARQWFFAMQKTVVRPLPCVSEKNAHNKGFDVRFVTFAVRFKRTTNLGFP